MPKIGPFFYIKDTLLCRSCPISEGREQAGKLDNSYGHDELWNEFFSFGDYIDYPRGRVVWDISNDRAIIYIDRCIEKPEILEKIVAAFDLPDYVIEHDDHYRCRDCVGELSF